MAQVFTFSGQYNFSQFNPPLKVFNPSRESWIIPITLHQSAFSSQKKMIASWLVQEFWNCSQIQKIERKKWKQNHQNIFRTSGGPVYASLLSRINRANISVSEREGRKSWKLGLEFPLSYKLALGQMVVFYRKAKNRFVCIA